MAEIGCAIGHVYLQKMVIGEETTSAIAFRKSICIKMLMLMPSQMTDTFRPYCSLLVGWLQCIRHPSSRCKSHENVANRFASRSGVLRSALWSQADRDRVVTWTTKAGEQRISFRGGVMLANRPLEDLPELVRWPNGNLPFISGSGS